MTLFCSKSFPLISAGPQKPQKLTAWMLKSKLVMTYFMFVLLRPRRNDREQFQRKEGRFFDFQAILKEKPLEQA